MSFNFSAQQFESAFEPKRLRNWEVTRKCAIATGKRSKFKEKPKMTNELKSTDKNSTEQVQLDQPAELDSKPVDKTFSSWERRSSHVPITNNWVEIDSSRLTNQVKEADTHLSADKDNNKPQTPQMLTQRSCQEISVQELATTQEAKSDSPQKEDPVLRNAYSNFAKAKSVRRNDYEHHTLADAIEWPGGNKKKSSSSPNIDIDTAAVGYKVYQSPSATQCSKLKVFRPKTASIIPDSSKENKCPPNERPKTTSRLQRRCPKPVGEMDLAIYWDVPPEQETIKPSAASCRRSSSEPAEKEEKKEYADVSSNLISGPVSSKPTNGCCPEVDRRHHSNRPVQKKTSNLVPELPKLEQLLQESSDSAADLSKRPSTTRQKSAIRSPTEGTEAPKRINIGVQVGSLDLRKVSKYCPGESMRNTTEKCTGHSNEYKMAFKAGKLNNFHINNALMDRLAKSRNLRVPKPKTPFAKKNYAIRTLMPPFSIWPQTTGYDYPDHWRLASVYQHAYKPLEARKNSFMKTVFQ